MQYGICPLGIVPIRIEANDASEMVTQVLYGETFKILKQQKKWSKIRIEFDQYEGWIDNKQYLEIDELSYKSLNKKPQTFNHNLVDYIENENNQLCPIPLGSQLEGLELLNHNFEGSINEPSLDKAKLIDTAYTYLNTPYLWGGKTPFGIDCSGFTQMVYKLNGYKLLRDASQQATQGEVLSFIEESEPGDLAFFDNAEGHIIHVGIIMENHYIIHAHGKVRIDRLDQTGIYNLDTRKHSHKLRVIKKII